MSLFSRNAALGGLFDAHIEELARQEELAPETVRAALEAGTMVLLGNPAHPGLRPLLVGQPSRIKVNANLGTSPLCNSRPRKTANSRPLWKPGPTR